MLVDFEKRMRFVNLVKYIIQRTGRDNIKELFGGNTDKPDNLIVMVMVFIMEHTLRYDEKCGKSDIEAFISNVSELYGIDKSNVEEVTNYILIDVLQNGGRLREFEVFKSSTESFEPAFCSIISEDNGFYKLTDEALDFLFRTKEIDNELDFSVSRFKLNEFIKRGNYSKALTQSRELVSRIRGLKTGMDDFMLRCRENISAVSVDEYEAIIKRVRDVFEDEQKQLEEIRDIVHKRLNEIIDTIQQGGTIANADTTESEIKEILENIEITIREQSAVYNKKFSLSEGYNRQLDEDFSYYISKRYNFEETLLAPAQRLICSDAEKLYRLFIPLTKPTFKSFFSIESLYARQKRLIDKSDEDFVDLNNVEDIVQSKTEIRNERFTEIIRLFINYATEHRLFRASEWIASITEEKLTYIGKENAIFDVLLKLYAQGEVDIANWKTSNDEIIVPMGEFDLAYCLSEVDPKLLKMDIIKISRDDKVFEITLEGGLNVSVTDFVVEVR
jgi:hypothetical protein